MVVGCQVYVSDGPGGVLRKGEARVGSEVRRRAVLHHCDGQGVVSGPLTLGPMQGEV